MAFWEWYAGVGHDEGPAKARKALDQIDQVTSDWDWVEIQGLIRQYLNQIFAEVGKPIKQPSVVLPRTLGTWSARDGSKYFYYGPFVPPEHTKDHIVALALEEILHDLNGLNREVAGQCPVCKHWFVRVRGTGKRFCSARCSWHAFKDRSTRRSKARRRVPAKGQKR